MSSYLDLRNSKEYEKLIEAAEIIKNGGIVVFPTETVYGIGVDALNEDAIRKLYKVKKREFNKKTSLLVSSIKMLEEFTQNITEIEYKLINKFFPGPLTLILHKKDTIPNLLSNNEEIVGFRMPANEIALKLIEKVGNPITTSSANIAGNPSGTNIESIRKSFGNNVDLYIDNGESEIGFGSTVVQIIDGQVHIIREGKITKEEIEKAIL